MVGLLDWLTEGLGGGGSGGMPPGLSDGPGGPPPPGIPPGMPPVQTLETAPPPAPPISGPQNHERMYPPGIDPMAAGGPMPNGPGLPMPTGGDPITTGGPVPNGPGLPPGLGGNPAALPPAAAPTGGTGMPPGLPPGMPMNIAPPVGAPPAPQTGGTALSRAMGLDSNTARQMGGSLAAGLKAAGENSHKPGLAAFAGSAGSAMEGGQKTDDKTFAQQEKYLARAIQAKKEGNDEVYRTSMLQFRIEEAKANLALEKEKMAKGGSGSVVNSPEQLYLRAVGATNQDAGIKISANTVKEAQKQFGPDSKEAKAALAEHEKRIESVRAGHFQTLGIDPKSVKGLESKPGFSDKNPVKDFPKDPAAAQKAFDALPDGSYFINPKDGRLLTKKSAGGAAAANPAQPPGPGAAPIPPMPTSPMVPQLEDAE
jgi:hypothetical protein